MVAIWLVSVKTQALPTTSWLHAHPPLPPYRSASGIGYTSKNYLKWWEIQLAIHPIVDEQIDYKQLQNCDKLHVSISFSSRVIILKIIIIGISKDFYLRVEGRLSQIQSHIIAIVVNPKENYFTYFNLSFNEPALNPGHFGKHQNNCTVLFMHNLICRSLDLHA